MYVIPNMDIMDIDLIGIFIPQGQESPGEHAVPVHVREGGDGGGGPLRRAGGAAAGRHLDAGPRGEGRVRARNTEGKEGCVQSDAGEVA